jgi:uncharacterized protein (TIGR02246 family)
MYRRFFLVLALTLIPFEIQGHVNDEERSVRDLINQWDAAYRRLDAKALAKLETSDFELVNRLGQWTPFKAREDNERMWAWAFTNIYNGKPGPEHSVERVRFIRPDTAIVQARAFWPDEITLPDGTRIPPHGEIDTFVVVKQKDGWRIASQNIHNQMPGEELPSQLPWENKGNSTTMH